MREMLREPLDHVASPHGDARVVVAGPAHGDVYRDGWRREEVLAEPQGRFGELVEARMSTRSDRARRAWDRGASAVATAPTPAASPCAGNTHSTAVEDLSPR